MARDFVAAIDSGTTSTRCIVVDAAGSVVAQHQLEHSQIFPAPGWVEHSPVEIWERTRAVVEIALASRGLTARDLAAVGLTNQRETTIVWDRRTGRPYANAIVWQDTRTDGIAAQLAGDGRGELIRERTGLPPATYFSGPKIQWLLENVRGLRAAAESGHALFGTTDAWLLWHLTGGVEGGRHLTDVTNASRTMLMDLRTLAWDAELLDMLRIPSSMLPHIRPSLDAESFGATRGDGPFRGEVPISAVLGDQHAATIGHACFNAGDAKNTYGTGNFLVTNTGNTAVRSDAGLLTTVAYQRATEPAVFALEGSVAVTGAAIQWLRDQLGIIRTAAESETLAARVPDAGGCVFVPAFSGLFAPYWRADARGTIVGLTRGTSAAHIARAALEAICFQTRAVVDAMAADMGAALPSLRVDGGITANALCMQIQADVLGVPVARPAIAETTALGAAFAAGLAVGFWPDEAAVRAALQPGRQWEPEWSADQRERAYATWQRAVDRSLGWVL